VNTVSIVALVGLKIYDNSKYETIIEERQDSSKLDRGLNKLLEKLG
jgi:hypothetical protein